MSSPGVTAPTEGPRPDNDEHRTLTRVAARILYAKALEETGLSEIDKIAAGIARTVRLSHMVTWIVSGAVFVLTALAMLAWVATSANRIDLGYRPFFVILPLALIAASPLWCWRYYQYGTGSSQKKIPALYANVNKSTIEVLESLFDYLARRTGPPVYYYDRSGRKQPVRRSIFRGRLRGLLLSESAGDRSLILPPAGIWFSAQIFVEAEPEDIIKAIKARPRSGTRNTKYDYVAILLVLIDHPALRDLPLGEHSVESRLMNLIRLLCDACDEHDNDIAVPGDSELRDFAKKVLAAIEKNRASPISPKTKPNRNLR